MTTPLAIENQIIALYTNPTENGDWIGSKIIAHKFHVSPETIRTILVRRGIKMRTIKEAHSNGKRCKPIINLPQGQPLFCKCGCRNLVEWNRRKNRWNAYIIGHYRQDAPYKHKDWLREQYELHFRSADFIAQECNVGATTIIKFMRKFGIPIRATGETLILNGSIRGERNPAWKGGVAQWAYATDWKRIARSIRKRDDYTCLICKIRFPKSSKFLHVHHIDGNKFNNSPDNLMTVCATCHPKGKRKVIS